MVKAGDRVGAVYSLKKNLIEFIGFGVYVGKEVPSEEASGVLAECLRDANIKSHKILLDSGSVIFGCECWWGPEKVIKRKMDKCKKVKKVELYMIRKEVK